MLQVTKINLPLLIFIDFPEDAFFKFIVVLNIQRGFLNILVHALIFGKLSQLSGQNLSNTFTLYTRGHSFYMLLHNDSFKIHDGNEVR